MITLKIDDIQRNLSEFIKLIQEGNSLIITQADRPIAEVKPIPINQSQKPPLPICLCEEKFDVPDDFDEQFAEEIINLFVNI